MFREWKVHSPAAATLNVIDGWEARAHQREERDEVARLRAASAALQEQSHSQNARRFPIQLARLGQAFDHENAAEGRRAELHPAQVERARQIVAHADAAEEQRAKLRPQQVRRGEQIIAHSDSAEGRRDDLHPLNVEQLQQAILHRTAAEERRAQLFPAQLERAEQIIELADSAEGRRDDLHPLNVEQLEQAIAIRAAAEDHRATMRPHAIESSELALTAGRRNERTAAATEQDNNRLKTMRDRMAAGGAATGNAILQDAEDFRVALASGDKNLLKQILQETDQRAAQGKVEARLRDENAADPDYQYPASVRLPEYPQSPVLTPPTAQPHEAILYDQQVAANNAKLADYRKALAAYESDQARLDTFLDERDAGDRWTKAATLQGDVLRDALLPERKLPAKLGKDERIPVWDKDGNLQLLGGGSAAGGIPGLENGIIRPTDGKGGLLPSALPVIKNAANYPPDEVMNAIAPGFSQDMLKDQAEAIEEGRTAPENVIELYRSVINEIYNPANASQTIDTLTANLIAEQKRLTPGGFGESVDRYMHEQYTKEAGNLAKRIGGSLSKTILGAMTSDQKQRLSGVFHGFVRRQKETLRKANAKFVEDNARRLTAQFPGAITYPEARGAIKRAYQISEYDSEWNKPALAADPLPVEVAAPVKDKKVLSGWTTSIGAFAGDESIPDEVVAAHPIGSGMLILDVLADGKKKMHISAPEDAVGWSAAKWKQMVESGALVLGEGYFSDANAK